MQATCSDALHRVPHELLANRSSHIGPPIAPPYCNSKRAVRQSVAVLANLDCGMTHALQHPNLQVQLVLEFPRPDLSSNVRSELLILVSLSLLGHRWRISTDWRACCPVSIVRQGVSIRRLLSLTGGASQVVARATLVGPRDYCAQGSRTNGWTSNLAT